MWGGAHLRKAVNNGLIPPGCCDEDGGPRVWWLRVNEEINCDDIYS